MYLGEARATILFHNLRKTPPEFRQCCSGQTLYSTNSQEANFHKRPRKASLSFKKGSARFLLLVAILVSLALVACVGRVQSPDGGWSGPVVVEDQLYIAARDGRVLRLDREEAGQSQINWSFPLSAKEDLEVVYGSPAVSADTVYVGRFNGNVEAIDLVGIDSRILGQTDGPIIGGPILTGGKVVVGSSDGSLYAWDADSENLQPAWVFETGDNIWSTPISDGETVYFGSMDKNFYAVSLEDGTEKWRYKSSAAIAGTALLHKGRVYIGNFDSRFFSLNAESGGLVWEYKTGGWFWSRPIADGSTVYAGFLDGKLYALDANTGQLKWPDPAKADGPILSAPVFVDEWIAFASDDEEVHVVQKKNGLEIWFYNVDAKVRAPLAAADGTVYVSAMDNKIWALDIPGSVQWQQSTKE